MKAPPGTWRGYRNVAPAKTRIEYRNHGPNSIDRRRTHAPTSRKGTSTTEQTITAKLPIADRRPPRRDAMIGPGPCARNFDSDGSAVMLFHSWIDRIQSALPPEVVGEIEPNVTSWRANHGPITTRYRAKQPTAARHGSCGARRPPESQARPRSQANTSPTARPRMKPSFRASDARPTRKPAAM